MELPPGAARFAAVWDRNVRERTGTAPRGRHRQLFCAGGRQLDPCRKDCRRGARIGRRLTDVFMLRPIRHLYSESFDPHSLLDLHSLGVAG